MTIEQKLKRGPIRVMLSIPLVALALLAALFLTNQAVIEAATDVQQNTLSGSNQSTPSDDDPDDEEIEMIGTVSRTPPHPSGHGEWKILQGDQVWTVIATPLTRLDRPLPSPGERVMVAGTRQRDGKILADRIRRDRFQADEVVVRLKEGVNPKGVAKRYGMEVVSSLLKSGNIHLFRAEHKHDGDDDEENLVAQLQRNESVIWAELNYISTAPIADPYQIWKWGGKDNSTYINQAAFDQIGLPAIQPFYQGGDVIVAVLDTGVSLTHPDLQARFLPGRDLVDDDWQPEESESGTVTGHGTHVAGIIAHIAPQSAILPIRVLDGDGRGNTFVVAYAIEWAVAQGADVINLSLGTPYDSEVLRETVAQATAQGVLIIAAAGNEANDEFQYPAAYPTTLAVTAVDEQNAKADFANFSDWIDIAAPGVGITSTVTGPEGDGYASWSGTSMATSFVSGVAALSRAANRQANSETIYHELIESAVDIDRFNSGYPGQVGRLLNATRALHASPLIYLPRVER